MRRSFFVIAFLTAAASLGLAGDVSDKAAVPRKAPEYQIDMPNGKSLLLSSFKGKVVCVEFLFTTCPHCQQAAILFSKLNNEFGPQGFQPLGIAINEMAGMLVNDFTREFKVNYPVGFSQRPMALQFLGIDADKRWVVPQVVLIDRKGKIRYQTPWGGDDKLKDEGFLRGLITGLIKEPSVMNAPSKKVPAKKAETGTN